MARVIDKEEKRCDIARASIDLFCEKGIQHTSIDEIAKSAGVAKGTVYLYFKNKEEIIFAIWNMIVEQHMIAFEQRVASLKGAKEKIMSFFDFAQCCNIFDTQKILHLYQHFVSAMLIDKTGLYTSYFESVFQKDYEFIAGCLQEGIDSGEFEPHDVHLLTNTMVFLIKGILVRSKASNLGFVEAQALLPQQLSFLIDNFTRKIK